MSEFESYYSYLKTRSLIGFLYRRYWLYPRLAKHLHGASLDVGCGLGDMLKFNRGMMGVDINPLLVEYCKNLGLNAILMQQDQLSFSDKSFDSVLLDNVLEHLTTPEKLLKEINRVLNTNGILVVGVPGHRGWLSDPDHKIFYDEVTMKECIEKLGFQWLCFFYAPTFKSHLMSKRLRQYCIYGIFLRNN